MRTPAAAVCKPASLGADNRGCRAAMQDRAPMARRIHCPDRQPDARLWPPLTRLARLRRIECKQEISKSKSVPFADITRIRFDGLALRLSAG